MAVTGFPAWQTKQEVHGVLIRCNTFHNISESSSLRVEVSQNFRTEIISNPFDNVLLANAHVLFLTVVQLSLFDPSVLVRGQQVIYKSHTLLGRRTKFKNC